MLKLAGESMDIMLERKRHQCGLDSKLVHITGAIYQCNKCEQNWMVNGGQYVFTRDIIAKREGGEA